MIKSSIPFFIAAILCAQSAIALDRSRQEVKSFIEDTAAEFNLDKKQIAELLGQAETKQAIIDAISRPAERVIPWHEYRDRFLTERRIQQGADFWVAHTQALDGVNDLGLAATISGILGVETSYGRITGRYRVLDALATLAFDYPPRAPFFRGELQQFLLLAREENVDPKVALGSYAGAMGIPQFIPTSYRKYAIDGDGNGKRDLWSSWQDVISSVANYLRVHGWREGEPVTVNATLDNVDLTRFNTATIELNETVGSLRDKGVSFATTQPDEAPAMLVVLQGKNGPEYRVGFNNFYVITRYNRSNMYALAVHELGGAIQGFMQDVKR
ncbi:MAG TPA: lytic murein transglycosylase B [Steroidobacteraceae bacterium]|nr:lytic murein transglycosylase B [Steroidobacteraceae bacterium]